MDDPKFGGREHKARRRIDANFLDLNLRIATSGLILWRPNWQVDFY
jgi:hypothetical protein